MTDLQQKIELLFTATNRTGAVISSVGNELDTLSGNIRNVTQPFADLTKAIFALDVILTGLAAGGIAYAYNESSKLQSSFTELKKVAGDNAEALELSKNNAKALSNEYGEGAGKVLESTANYKQAGYDINEAMTLAKDGMDLVIAGGVSAYESSEILLSILKGFDAPASEARDALDILNEVSNQYATNVVELGNAMGGLSPVAKQMGFSMSETAGLVTPVIETFRSGDEAAVALKTGLLKLISDTKPVQETLASIGVSQKDLNGQLRSGKDIFIDVANAFQGMDENQKLFVTQQLVGIDQSARMVKVFDNLAQYTKITATAMNSAGSAAREVAERLKDPEVVINRLVEGFNNLSGSIGDDFQESATEAVDGVTTILNVLQDAVDKGAFAPILDAFNDFLDGITGGLESVAKNLPDALEKIDYTGFLGSLSELRNTISGLFDGISFDSPEALAAAIQKIVDAFDALVSFSNGIFNVFTGLVEYLSPVVDKFISLDESTQKFLGTITGAGATIAGLALPIGTLGTALGGLTSAFQAASGALAFFLGLKMAEEINEDLYGVDETLTAFKKSAAELQEEIEKLEGVNGTMYKFFKGEDKDTVLDELRAKLQLVNDKIKIIEDENQGKDIFAETKDSAKELQNALDHIVPTFEKLEAKKEINIDIEQSALKELENAANHISAKFEETHQVVKVWKESTGKWETIVVPVDTTQVDDAKKKIEDIPAEKKLKFETDLKIEEIKAKAQTIEAAMKFKAEVDIAQIEAEAKVATAAFDSIGKTVAATASAAEGMFSSLAKFEGSMSDKWFLQDILKEQVALEREAIESQKALNESWAKYYDARTERMKSGEADISLQMDGVYPHLEAIFWEIINSLRIRAANEDIAALLLGA